MIYRKVKRIFQIARDFITNFIRLQPSQLQPNKKYFLSVLPFTFFLLFVTIILTSFTGEIPLCIG